MPKKIKALIAVVIVAILLIALFWYWQREKIYPSTDDAYVQANIIHLAPQVSGRIAVLAVKNNQHVTKGKLLFQLDQKPFLYKLQQAKAQLKQTEKNILAKIDAVKTAQASVNQRKAELLVAKQNHQRIITLVNENQAPKSEGDAVTSKWRAAEAALIAAESQVLKAKAELGQTNANNADLQVAKAAVRLAKLNLQYTTLRAPAAGILVDMTLRKGDVVTANQPLFSLVENNHWWVNANYKETDLKRIHPGQHASILLDIYPNTTFHGTVESISAGSGAAFSILPPENATGNWVKVTQRFPVKILMSHPNPKTPLRVGASATVTINTRS